MLLSANGHRDAAPTHGFPEGDAGRRSARGSRVILLIIAHFTGDGQQESEKNPETFRKMRGIRGKTVARKRILCYNNRKEKAGGARLRFPNPKGDAICIRLFINDP